MLEREDNVFLMLSREKLFAAIYPETSREIFLDYLKKVVIHTLVEWEHLYTFLPALYAEYKDQPMDAD